MISDVSLKTVIVIGVAACEEMPMDEFPGWTPAAICPEMLIWEFEETKVAREVR